jgi:hypothetical protein
MATASTGGAAGVATSGGRYLRLRRLTSFASMRVTRPLGDFNAFFGILAFLR